MANGRVGLGAADLLVLERRVCRRCNCPLN